VEEDEEIGVTRVSFDFDSNADPLTAQRAMQFVINSHTMKYGEPPMLLILPPKVWGLIEHSKHELLRHRYEGGVIGVSRQGEQFMGVPFYCSHKVTKIIPIAKDVHIELIEWDKAKEKNEPKG